MAINVLSQKHGKKSIEMVIVVSDLAILQKN